MKARTAVVRAFYALGDQPQSIMLRIVITPSGIPSIVPRKGIPKVLPMSNP